MLIGYHFYKSCKIVVRFDSVTMEFNMQEIVQLASIILPHVVQLRLLGDGAVRHGGDQ